MVKAPVTRSPGVQIKKPSGGLFTPLMASDLFDLPEASDGDAYNDPDNNDDYREGRGNSACEAVEHCQKFQFSGKVFEMQVGVYIKDIYACISRGSLRGTARGLWGGRLDNTLKESVVITRAGAVRPNEAKSKVSGFVSSGLRNESAHS